MTRPLYEVRADGILTANLHPGQIKAIESTKRFVFMLAGNQSGKTEFGPFWLFKEMQRQGPGDYLAVSPTYDLQNLKLVPAYTRFFRMMLGTQAIYKKSDRILEVIDGGDIYNIFMRSADKPESLESATAKAAHLDEVGMDQVRLEAWEAILRRLSINQGRILGTTTLYNTGWMKREVFDRWEQGDPDFEVIQFDSIENPAYPLAEYQRAKNTLPSWKFDLFYRGRYARPAGMIYNDFEDKVHLVKPFDIPIEWPRHVGIDPGGVNTATIWLAEDVDRKAYYIYRSTLSGGKTTKEHCADALAYTKKERVVSWCGGARSEGQFRKDWNAEGVDVRESPVFDVEGGIDRIISLLKQKRLFIFDNDSNRRLLDEIGSYSRLLDDRQEPTEKIKDKETYHILDSLRYIVSYVTDTSESINSMSDTFGDYFSTKSR